MELNKIHNSDCIEFMKSITTDSIDYTFTSPPYNFGSKEKYKEFDDGKTQEEYFE